jgi:hypothetical protein
MAVMRLLRAILAGALGACAALVVACGDSNGLLAPGDASSLSSQLDAVSSAVDGGHCTAASAAAQDLQDAVVSLPGTVNRKLVTSLRNGAAKVESSAAQDCGNAKTTTSDTTTTDTVPTVTTTTTATVPTTPTQTVTTTTTPTTPTTPTTTPTTPTTTPTVPSTGGGTGGGTTGGGTGGGGAGTGGGAGAGGGGGGAPPGGGQ